MKGLIRYNLYVLREAITASIIMSVLVGFAGIIAIIIYSNSKHFELFSLFSIAPVLIFAILNMLSINERNKNNWVKYELTTAVSKKDIISSLYLTDIICTLLGLILSIIFFIVSIVITGFEIIQPTIKLWGFLIIAAGSIPLIGVAFARPISLLISKNINAIVLCVVYISYTQILNFLNHLAEINKDEQFTAGYILLGIFNIALYFISYFISLKIYAKKQNYTL